ncbi:MAG TPA: hypothetical protein VMV52_01505 [Candidatus Nanopelagicaceae bacterium]|nr:hypothetical protein [Candidatus Nanopelagicaceae bacterium]
METLLQTPVVEAGRISLVATASFMGWKVNSRVYFEFLEESKAWVLRQRDVPQFVRAHRATYSAIESFIDAKHRLSIPRVVLDTLGIELQSQAFVLAVRPRSKKKNPRVEPAVFLLSANDAAQIVIKAINDSG